MYILKQYNDYDFRLIKLKYIKKKHFFKNKNNNNNSKEEIERISLSRTKRNIREIALCNDWDFFATLTINSNYNRYSLEDTQKLIKKTIKKIQRKNNIHMNYILITEKHKDGAFHFHGLFSNIPNIYINKYGYFSSHDFDVLGFNSFSKIKSFTKTCNYITKYISKNCIKNNHNQIYMCSRGLMKATTHNINIEKNIDNFFSFENEFCKIRDFSLDNLSKNDIQLIQEIISIK